MSSPQFFYLKLKGRRLTPKKALIMLIKRKERKIIIKPKSAYIILSRPLLSFSFCPLDWIMSNPPLNKNQRDTKTAITTIRIIKTHMAFNPVVSPPVGTPRGKSESIFIGVPFIPGIDKAIFIAMNYESRIMNHGF